MTRTQNFKEKKNKFVSFALTWYKVMTLFYFNFYNYCQITLKQELNANFQVLKYISKGGKKRKNYGDT